MCKYIRIIKYKNFKAETILTESSHFNFYKMCELKQKI